jgi:hypothetical protein
MACFVNDVGLGGCLVPQRPQVLGVEEVRGHLEHANPLHASNHVGDSPKCWDWCGLGDCAEIEALNELRTSWEPTTHVWLLTVL